MAIKYLNIIVCFMLTQQPLLSMKSGKNPFTNNVPKSTSTNNSNLRLKRPEFKEIPDSFYQNQSVKKSNNGLTQENKLTQPSGENSVQPQSLLQQFKTATKQEMLDAITRTKRGGDGFSGNTYVEVKNLNGTTTRKIYDSNKNHIQTIVTSADKNNTTTITNRNGGKSIVNKKNDEITSKTTITPQSKTHTVVENNTEFNKVKFNHKVTNITHENPVNPVNPIEIDKNAINNNVFNSIKSFKTKQEVTSFIDGILQSTRLLRTKEFIKAQTQLVMAWKPTISRPDFNKLWQPLESFFTKKSDKQEGIEMKNMKNKENNTVNSKSFIDLTAKQNKNTNSVKEPVTQLNDPDAYLNALLQVPDPTNPKSNPTQVLPTSNHNVPTLQQMSLYNNNKSKKSEKNNNDLLNQSLQQSTKNVWADAAKIVQEKSPTNKGHYDPDYAQQFATHNRYTYSSENLMNNKKENRTIHEILNLKLDSNI